MNWIGVKLRRSNNMFPEHLLMEFLEMESREIYNLKVVDKFKTIHFNFKFRKKATSLSVRWFQPRSK